MKPHCMSQGSLLFDTAEAMELGVGRALHRTPAKNVQQLNASREDLVQICAYDVNNTPWKLVFEALRVLPDHDHTVNWSDGALFPWWVWLANTGKLRDVVNEGVKTVQLEVAAGKKSVVVHSVRGIFRLSPHPDYGTMFFHPRPPRYDP
jgi:hypothetical protein